MDLRECSKSCPFFSSLVSCSVIRVIDSQNIPNWKAIIDFNSWLHTGARMFVSYHLLSKQCWGLRRILKGPELYDQIYAHKCTLLAGLFWTLKMSQQLKRVLYLLVLLANILFLLPISIKKEMAWHLTEVFSIVLQISLVFSTSGKLEIGNFQQMTNGIPFYLLFIMASSTFFYFLFFSPYSLKLTVQHCHIMEK